MGKRILSTLLVFSLVLAGLFVPTRTVHAITSGDYEYEVLADGTVEITKYNGSGSNVSIPSTLDGRNVTSIGDEAFYECDRITDITIPAGVTNIGKDAFCFCESLTDITIPEGVTTIQDGSFSFCYNLTNVTIPSTVTSIGKDAFIVCKNLSSVVLPDALVSIGESAFQGCSNLTDIAIPPSVTSIGDSAFVACTALTAVTIPASVASIGKNAFTYCISLMSFEVEQGNENFSSADGILFNKDKTELVACPNGKTSVVIPDSVNRIGESAFERCDYLTSIELPQNVQSVGTDAFYGCQNLKSITVLNPNLPLDDAGFGVYGIDPPWLVSGLVFYGYRGSTAENIVNKANLGEIDADIEDDPFILWTFIPLDEDGSTPTTYAISYDLDGGNATGNPTAYTANALPFALRNPWRTGYRFTGWTGSNGSTPQTSVTIPTGTTGDLSYKANWEKTDDTTQEPTEPDETKPTEPETPTKPTTPEPKPTKPDEQGKPIPTPSPTPRPSDYDDDDDDDDEEEADVPAETHFTKIRHYKCGCYMDITWKKVSKVSGYNFQYATDKGFKSVEKRWIKDKQKNKITLSGLTKDKTYYIRIRTYKIEDGKKHFSDWVGYATKS